MKTIEQILSDYQSQTLDGRDISRLAQFLTDEQLSTLGFDVKEEFKGTRQIVEWTRENVLAQLQKDVDFGFEKALNQRGISAGLMYNVVQMWNFFLEEGLEDFSTYAMYGLPLFKATAVMYGFDNPIGDDTGEEQKYND